MLGCMKHILLRSEDFVRVDHCMASRMRCSDRLAPGWQQTNDGILLCVCRIRDHSRVEAAGQPAPGKLEAFDHVCSGQ